MLPELYSDLEEEEINFSEFVPQWLNFILAPQLALQNTLRLWDVYFSMNDFLEFHPFVCISILSSLKESLEDLEHSEIKSIILRLPELDISSVSIHCI
ncbi:GTPase-activating protein gyp1 [Smittium mucronatum]|uniref:GTPase-activating protein gyp1 n=1 Tax=Smittium mucronatum TaxID=133383 RepID=A0A1R0GMZ8_9FUNG|nr:GTPase-activating protein gyp1 [Smittium mucronatum]